MFRGSLGAGKDVKKLIWVAVVLTHTGAITPTCLALSIPSPSAKKPQLKTPLYQKLFDGAGPDTNDVNGKSTVTENSSQKSSVNLTPVTLTADKANLSDSGTTDLDSKDSKAYLKSSVSVTGFLPKEPIERSESIVNGSKDKTSIGDRILQKAKQVNIVPLPLMESEDELKKKADTVQDAERGELADLWEATLSRSPDIHFVIQKLMPNNGNPGRASTIMCRMLSTAMFGAMNAVGMMAPNVGVYAANSVGASMIMNVLGMQENKIAKNARLSQTEAIMLYNMVRATADRLVDCYRNYKKNMHSWTIATKDLQDLQNMVADARQGQDTTKQLEMHYTLRKAQRDVESVSEDIKRYRQGLVDLAGPEAVDKLDKDIEVHAAKVEQITPVGTENPQTAAAPGSQYN